MYFSSEFIDLLRERIRISDVVGQKVKLSPRGKEYYGLCPFHAEKTPSFTVNNDKNFYHCFGCGEHGDVVKFVVETRGLDFVEAVKALAQEHGIAIPENHTEAEISSIQKLAGFYQVMAMAAKWFNEKLYSTHGLQAFKYLKGRGLTDEIIGKFNLGFAPDNIDSLYKFLLTQSVTKEQMIATGLITEPKSQVYDRFRNRIVFPIYDNKSRIIGFGGRLLAESDNAPKYLNSPETVLFKKGHNLYAENLVLNSANKNKSIVIVEGYMDVIALNLVGINNVVATLGTAITQEHLQKIWRYCPNPILCMDGDRAGINAMDRCAKLALSMLKPGYSVQFVKLPAGYDPDDVAKNFGKNHLQSLLDAPIPLSEMLWQTSLHKLEVKTPEQKALLQKNLLDLAEEITHPNVKQFYKKFFNDRLWQNFSSYGTQNKVKEHKSSINGDLVNVKSLSALQRCELCLIALVIEYPFLLRNSQIYENFIMIESKINLSRDIYKAVEEAFVSASAIESDKDFSNNFKIGIGEKLLPTQLNFLCGDNSYFIDKISIKNDNDIVTLWEEAFDNYNLELLKTEYKNAMQSLDEGSMKIAIALQEEIIKLEQHIKEKIE
jgi:DNA primase catalytic core